MLLILIAIYFKARGEFLQQILFLLFLRKATTKSTQKTVYFFQQNFSIQFDY